MKNRFHAHLHTGLRVGAAALALTATLAATTTTRAQETLEPVELSYYYIGWPVTDLQAVNDAVNAITREEINATIRLNLIDWGSFTERMRVLIASGEQCDLMLTTRSDWNNYGAAVANGALLPLDDLLPEYAPTVWNDIPADIWNSARVNGQIYGVLGRGNSAIAYGAWVRRDLMETYGFDWEAASSWDDLEPLYDQIVANEPDVTPVLSTDGGPHGKLWFPEYWGVDPLGSPAGVLGVRVHGDTLQVEASVDLPEYQQAVEMARDWYNRGFFTADPLPDGDMQTDRAAGRYSTMIWNVLPGLEAIVADAEWGGRPIEMLELSEPVVTTGSVAGAFTSVCATSPNPERALMFIDLMNSNPELYNLLVFGIEGQHWVWEDESQNLVTIPEGMTSDQVNAAYRGPDWVFGNQYLKYFTDPSEFSRVDEWQALAESAALSPALGFTADYTTVATEIAQITSVYEQYGEPLEKGLVDPATALPEYRDRLREAGLDTVIAEVQRQLDEWQASSAE